MSSDNWSPKVARALHEYHDAAPLPPSPEALASHRPPAPPRHVSVTVVAMVLAVLGIAGVAAVVGRHDAGPSGGGTVQVVHSQYRVSIDAQLTCDTPIVGANTFDSVLIDMWADRSGRQWRHQVTYPDGTTFDLLWRGSVVYPTELFERGTVLSRTVGCVLANGEQVTLASIVDPSDSITLSPELAADERAFVRLYDQTGQLVDNNAVDSQGRAAHLWEWRTVGTAQFVDSSEQPTRQTTSWWIDATDDTTVNERRFENTIDTLGTGTQTDTLLLRETVEVPTSIFDPSGYRSIETSPRPNTPPGPDTTAIVSPTVGTDPSTTSVGPTDTSVATDCVGDDLDLAYEPRGWRQPENVLWYRNGCVVRIDVITDRRGPEHCGWSSARVIVVGSPLGTPFTNTNDDVEYIRDPAFVLGDGIGAGYEANATLPADAVDTGYSTDTEAMWVVPGDDRFIYLVLSDRVERWPKGESPLCD